jgi:fructose-specific phosphotransferase system IIC component
VAELRQATQEAKAEATTLITGEVLRAFERAAARHLRMIAVKMVVGAVGAAALVSLGMWLWLSHVPPAAITCFDDRGGRFCGWWVDPPVKGTRS